MLTNLIKDADPTQEGLAEAMTRASQDVESYDRATGLERMGSDILERPKKDWRTLAE